MFITLSPITKQSIVRYPPHVACCEEMVYWSLSGVPKRCRVLLPIIVMTKGYFKHWTWGKRGLPSSHNKVEFEKLQVSLYCKREKKTKRWEGEDIAGRSFNKNIRRTPEGCEDQIYTSSLLSFHHLWWGCSNLDSCAPNFIVGIQHPYVSWCMRSGPSGNDF
jgi:hypothetical protein